MFERLRSILQQRGTVVSKLAFRNSRSLRKTRKIVSHPRKLADRRGANWNLSRLPPTRAPPFPGRRRWLPDLGHVATRTRCSTGSPALRECRANACRCIRRSGSIPCSIRSGTIRASKNSPSRKHRNNNANFSDKFGHRNCVILRESALHRFSANAVNALILAHLSENRAILRSQ
jgi:hypothetical protein